MWNRFVSLLSLTFLFCFGAGSAEVGIAFWKAEVDMQRDIFNWNAEVESINWNAEVAIVFWNAEVDIVNWNADVVDIANRKAEGYIVN